MAKKTFTACAAALILCAGCGTFNNVTGHAGPAPLPAGHQEAYGGFKMSLGSFGEAFGLGDAGRSDTGIELVPYLTLIDAPLSFVGDTLTLPYTWYTEYAMNHPASGKRITDAPPDRAVMPTAASQPPSP
jgi:uncharacterized protein YceK